MSNVKAVRVKRGVKDIRLSYVAVDRFLAEVAFGLQKSTMRRVAVMIAKQSVGVGHICTSASSSHVHPCLRCAHGK